MRRNPSISINGTSRFGNIDAESHEKVIDVNSVAVTLRTRHFIIGSIVLCLSILVGAHMIISFAVVPQQQYSGNTDISIHKLEQTWTVLLKKLHVNGNNVNFMEKIDDYNHSSNHAISNISMRNIGVERVSNRSSRSYAIHNNSSGIRHDPRYFYDLSTLSSSPYSKEILTGYVY
jgi:hypothetical protein